MSTRKTSGRGCGTIFLGFFFLIGSLFVVIMLREAYRTALTYGWTEGACEILVSEGKVIPNVPDDEPPYRFHVVYRFDWEGQSRTAGTLRPDNPEYSDWSDVRELVETYPVGSRTACFVDPQDPERATLKRQGLWLLLFLPLPLLFVAIGGGGMYFLWFRRETPERLESISSKARGSAPRWVLPIVFGFMAILGGGLFAGLFLEPLKQAISSPGWEEMTCTVEFSRVGTHRGDDSTTYSIDVLYSYEFDGTTHRSSQYGIFNFSSSGYRDKREIVRRYPKGAEVACYVNPSDPEQAVLDRSLSAGLLLCLIPLAFFLCGLVGLRYQWKKISAAGDLSREYLAGPLVLKPKVGRWGKLAGVTIFALIWNGITGVFLYQVIEEWKRGDQPWLMTLFLAPFVLVGLGALVGIVHSTLALFNPVPRLTLSPGVLFPGSSATIEWTVSGNASALQDLKIVLEGREEADYAEGKRRRSLNDTFSAIEVSGSGPGGLVGRGSASLRVPRDAMHSFESANNKIVWVLKVSGDVRRWPDVDLELPIRVDPLVNPPGSSDDDSEPASASSEGLDITTRHSRRRPGDTVEGEVGWNLAAAPEKLELRLFWFTRGSGNQDVAVVETASIDTQFSETGRRPFRFRLPNAPYSFQGKRISIVWALEVIAQPNGATARLELE